MHEPPAATADLAVLPGVLGSRTLRRTEKVRLRFESRGGAGRLPGGAAIFMVSLRRPVHDAGWQVELALDALWETPLPPVGGSVGSARRGFFNNPIGRRRRNKKRLTSVARLW
jgi:hypothetical protein